jgi:hypothetical protein
MATAIDPARLEEVNTWPIFAGSHAEASEKACIMEAVAFVAGEPWSDHPQCSCPVIAAFMRRWNDGIRDDEVRTRLLRPLVPRLVGTRSSQDVEMKRAYLAIDWTIRVSAPAWLELAGLGDQATLLRELAEVCDAASARVASKHAREARTAAAERRAANWGKLRDAAAAAAYAAAADAAAYAAYAYAYAAAAAYAADAYAAAYAAYAYAADAYAYAAAAAAYAKLQPTVEAMQLSALDLVERMIAVTE